MIGPLLILWLAQAPVLKLPADAVAAGPANLNFEAGEAGKAPPEWALVQESRVAGYTVEVRKSGCHSGSGCAVIAAGNQTNGSDTGAIIQEFSAEPYMGKRMRLRAWVRLENGSRRSSIKVAFATDGEKGNATFMQRKRGVDSAEWTGVEIQGKVPSRAELIHIMVTVSGKAKAWVDDVSFEEVK